MLATIDTGELRRTLGRLSRHLRRQSAAGLTATAISALGTIERGDGLTLGELAAAEGVQPPTMTRLVDSLSAAGLVVRTPDPSDRRVSRVHLTSDGRRRLAKARSEVERVLGRALARLSDDETRRLAGALPVLQRLVRETTA